MRGTENSGTIQRQLFLLLFGLILSVISCKKDSDLSQNPDLGYNYFPVDSGRWIVYKADSIVHNDFTGTVDTFRFQIMEVMAGDFKDNEGRVSQRLERYKRENETSSWKIKDVWWMTKTATRAEQSEENRRYIKLAFPVKNGQSWDGNALNTETAQHYSYEDVHEPYQINGLSFDSVVTVLQQDQLNIIEKKYSIEKYAKGVGMVYKEYISLDFQKDAGVEYTLKIIAYGQ